MKIYGPAVVYSYRQHCNLVNTYNDNARCSSATPADDHRVPRRRAVEGRDGRVAWESGSARARRMTAWFWTLPRAGPGGSPPTPAGDRDRLQPYGRLDRDRPPARAAARQVVGQLSHQGSVPSSRT
ncbi:hypothetical protein SSCG_02171 [Streptomyces clavuligerus]|nr:hypothetical protein SSCG_02171 [Streptomyces clavuligerus]